MVFKLEISLNNPLEYSKLERTARSKRLKKARVFTPQEFASMDYKDPEYIRHIANLHGNSWEKNTKVECS